MADLLPSLPFLMTASLPEVIWVGVSIFGTWMALRAYFKATSARFRLKHAIRAVAIMVFLVNGLIAAATPPPVNPNWLTVLTPMTIAFGVFSMSLLSVIDEQAGEDR